jgi:hypothetical protein
MFLVYIFGKQMLRQLSIGILVGAITLLANNPAKGITISASSDTYVTEHAGLGGSSSVHGTDNILYEARGEGVFRAFPLVKFDLSYLSGSNVSGSTAELKLELIDGWNGNFVTQSISVRSVLTSWDESTANWANFGGTGFDENTHTGSNLVTQDVSYDGQSKSVSFIIPSTVVQGWLDDPASNNGVILISNTTINQTDLVFSSREGDVVPTLSFNLSPVNQVPEPTTILGSLVALGLGSAVRHRFLFSSQRK